VRVARGIELLEFLLEMVLEIVVGLVWEIIVSLYKAVFDRSNWGALAAMLGYFLLGVAMGGVSIYFWPTRVFQPGFVPGLSLVLSPLCVGWALAVWGNSRHAHGRLTSRLATFSGGAAFGFGTALVRFIWAS
jgi:hypothetical protein